MNPKNFNQIAEANESSLTWSYHTLSSSSNVPINVKQSDSRAIDGLFPTTFCKFEEQLPKIVPVELSVLVSHSNGLYNQTHMIDLLGTATMKKMVLLGCLITTSLLVSRAQAQPEVLIDTNGVPSNGVVVRSIQYAAVEFSLAEDASNVLIEAMLGSSPGNTGTAYLTTAIGPGATATDVIASEEFTFKEISSFDEHDYIPVLSGLDLAADDYFLIFGDPISGFGGGLALSPDATYTTVPSASVGDMLFSTTEEPFVPSSTFATSTLGNYFFRVTAVPEPSSFAFIALTGFALLRRRRSSR